MNPPTTPTTPDSIPRSALILGAGFAGLAAACCLAQAGVRVTVLEKNAQPGGRARRWEQDGFTFDLGPSWYWMPDVFEQFFARFGKQVADYYTLRRLDPSYRVVFGPDASIDVPASVAELEALFEEREPGSAARLRAFLREAAYKYEVGMNDFVRRPSESLLEFADPRLIPAVLRLGMLGSFRKHVHRVVRDPQLRQILEFPVLFLGATPQKTPAMYSLMNHADLVLGTWYPMGGMHRVVEALVALATDLGVTLRCNEEATEIRVEQGAVTGVATATDHYDADVVVAGADYHHVEQHLLPPAYRHYTPAYWDRRVMSPSSLLFYLGVNKRLTGLKHHTLFFDEDLDQHAHQIYEAPAWPTRPLFYACCPSRTDPSVAPSGCENLFLLVPVAPGLSDDDATRERLYDVVMTRLETLTGQSIRDDVVVYRSYAHRDFIADYHAFKGNAYGLANTLRQTAFLKPRMRAHNVRGLFYTGQLTVPGPGVPPSLISGEVVSDVVLKG